MNPVDGVFTAVAADGGADGSETAGASCMSCCAVFVLTFLPSFVFVGKGARNPEMDVGRPLPLSALEKALASSTSSCSSSSGSCVRGQRHDRWREMCQLCENGFMHGPLSAGPLVRDH